MTARGQPVQGLAQILAGHALDLARARHQRVERAELGQPFGGGFGADFFHAGHVVHRIPHQGLKIDHQAGRHAKFGGDTCHIAALAIHGVDDGDVLVHQLAQVLVAAGHDHLDALCRSGARQGANDVVGFHTAHIQHGPAQEAHDFVDGLYLGPQIVGHGRTLGFVSRVNFIAEGGAFGIEDAGRIQGGVFLAQALHHVDHAANGARGRAGRVARHGTQVGHGVKRPVKVAGTIDQQQKRGGSHGCIVPWQTRPWERALQCRIH